MALRKIVKEGDPVLARVCRPVEVFDKKLATLVEDMKDTLAEANGAGLAAPQVGIAKRLCIVVDDDDSIMTLINPQIIETKGEQIFTEGCLSVPGIWGKTRRPAEVTVRAYDVNGKAFTATRTGITAVCFCHEIDHLDGKLFREQVFEYVREEDL